MKHYVFSEEQEQQELKAKLNEIRQAAKKGFDEIDQGKGIVLKCKELEIGRVLHDSMDFKANLPDDYRRSPD